MHCEKRLTNMNRNIQWQPNRGYFALHTLHLNAGPRSANALITLQHETAPVRHKFGGWNFPA